MEAGGIFLVKMNVLLNFCSAFAYYDYIFAFNGVDCSTTPQYDGWSTDDLNLKRSELLFMDSP